MGRREVVGLVTLAARGEATDPSSAIPRGNAHFNGHGVGGEDLHFRRWFRWRSHGAHVLTA